MGGGAVDFFDDGLWFEDLTGQRRVAVIPYDAIGDPSISVDPNGGCAVVAPVSIGDAVRLELHVDDITPRLEWLADHRGE